jgi:hypothetical protein
MARASWRRVCGGATAPAARRRPPARPGRGSAIDQPATLTAVGFSGCEVNRCVDGKLCLFIDGGYQSYRYRFNLNHNDNHYEDEIWEETSDNQVDNDTSSVMNNTGAWVALFRDANYGSHSVCIAPRTGESNLGSHVIQTFPHTTMDNKLSSHVWGTASQPPYNGRGSCDFIVE